MTFSNIAQYLAARRGLDDADEFSMAINHIFAALEEGNTVIDNTLHNSQALQDKYLLNKGESMQTPLISHDRFLSFNRIFQWEKTLAQDIHERIKYSILNTPKLDKEATKLLNRQQYRAVELALKQRLTIINGGPGTGKTYTVSHIVRAIIQDNPQVRIAFAAPTGKAAKRMEESLKQNILLQPYLEQLPEAQTIHRLLGLNYGRDPIYHHHQLLPIDLLIIDEASMLSLELAKALFAACSPKARLILLGDANQLAAVDAGAVLHDLSNHPVLMPFIITLTETHRFDSESSIGQLALSLQQKNCQNIRPFLEDQSNINWHPIIDTDIYKKLFLPYQSFIDTLQQSAFNPQKSFEEFDKYRILCAGHLGSLGVESINQQLSYFHLHTLQQPLGQTAYHGMPILITANNYDLNIFNGDIGLCAADQYGMQVYFPEKEQPIPLSAISPFHWKLAYALTVHKSQGSEYERVALLMDETNERLLTRELLYTGLTRAKKDIDIYASEKVLQQAANCSVKRQTGLAELL